MTEQQNAPAPSREWNPLASVEPVTLPLDVSGGAASIILRRWTGRERLAYEDAITERMLTTTSGGEETVKIGTLRLYAISLTVVGEVGFPKRPDGSSLFTAGKDGDRRLAVEADLLALDPDTFDEIRAKALELQPLPSADESDDDKGDDDEATMPDPSPASSTPPTPAVPVDDSGSLPE